MCGICGRYNFQDAKVINREAISRMTRSLFRRGPDEEGFLITDKIGLGVRRLCIRDKEFGKQPIYNEDKTICCIYNGEIYNYKELKKYLIEKGHIFISNSDGEVIPHLYEEMGELFIEKLNGMFAMALLDLKNNNLLIARDRIGIKPLYYFEMNGAFVFSSAVSSLLQDEEITLEIDRHGANCYFSYNYFPGGYSPLKGVKKLLPGSYIKCNSEGIKIRNYWQWSFAVDVKRKEFYEDKFRAIFADVVRDHLEADVPVGIFLSGGLDSSGLAYFVSKIRKDVDVFTIGFKESTYDERTYAAIVAAHLGFRHRKIIIEDEIGELFKKTIYSSDIPIGEPSLLPTFKLAEFSKKYAGVILSGEGADELFGGYDTYKADILAAFFRHIPSAFKKYFFYPIAKTLPISYKYLNFRLKSELFLKGILNNKIPHYSWREVFSKEDKKNLYSKELLSHLSATDSFEEPFYIFEKYFNMIDSQNYLQKAMFFDTKIWLPESVLQRVDMASMHHSLEIRVPFLDNRIVEFASSVPVNRKIRHMKGKYLLRKIFSEGLPKKILNRSKHGFSVPISRWLRHELKDLSLDILAHANKDIYTLLNRNYLTFLLRQHISGAADNGRKLWNIITFILWYDSLMTKKQKGYIT